jgi:hypothetical protein
MVSERLAVWRLHLSPLLVAEIALQLFGLKSIRQAVLMVLVA